VCCTNCYIAIEGLDKNNFKFHIYLQKIYDPFTTTNLAVSVVFNVIDLYNIVISQ